jgi:hypothetical protein
MITSTLEGRLVTLTNRTAASIGAAGKVVRPGKAVSVPLAVVQGNAHYMDEINAYIANPGSGLSVDVDGSPITASNVATLDAPIGGDFQATREVWDNLAAADADAIKVAFTAPAADTTYSGSDLDGAVGPGEMLPPRNIVITGTTGVGEALDGGTAVVIGEDADGVLRTENFTLAAIGASSSDVQTGVIAFKRIVSVTMPADASGSPGDYEIGFGVKIGLARKLSQGALLKEFTNNAVPGTAATVVLAGTSAPNGTVQFDTAPNGTNDYAVVYVPD